MPELPLRSLRLVGLCLLALGAAAAPANAAEVDLPRYPSVSPDGQTVSFSWRGDLWKVPTAGGHAQRLTSHPAQEMRTAWSPRGDRIAFESERTGALNLFTMKPDGTDVRQVTRVDHYCVMSGFSGDGTKLLFQARREGDVYRETRPYQVAVTGGPITRVHDAFARRPETTKDGQRVLFTRGGSSWLRRHYRGPDQRDLWLLDRGAGTFSRLTTWTGNDGLASWQDDTHALFLSDRELDTVNAYRIDVTAGEPSVRRLTSFEGVDVTYLDVAANGRVAVLAAWDRLYRLDLAAGGRAEPITITAPQDRAGDRIRRQDISSKVSEAALDPHGKVMAVSAYGEIFVRGLGKRDATRRVTETAAREKDIAWSPDGQTLYFVSDRDGTESIYAARVKLTRDDVKKAYGTATEPPKEEPAAEAETEADVAPATEEPAKPDAGGEEKPDGDAKPEVDAAPDSDTKPEVDAEPDAEAEPEKEPEGQKVHERWIDALEFVITPVIATEHHDRAPVISPDGTRIAFRRGGGDLAIHDLLSGTTSVFRSGWDTGLEVRWSPDGHHLAFAVSDRDFNRDIWIARADGSTEPVNISRHPATDALPRWSADGKILAFVSERIDHEADVWAVYLDRSHEVMPRAELDAYYKDAAAAAKKRKPPKPPAEGELPERSEAEVPELDLDDAYLRLRRLSKLKGSEWNLALTPGGERVVYSGTDTTSGLFTAEWDGSGQKRIGSSVSVQHVSLAGDKVVYVSGGRAGTLDPGKGDAKPVAISARIDIDVEEAASQRFLEAARVVGEVFYDPTIKGLDWEAYTQRYHELARRARTASEWNTVAARLMGELNASHLGIRAATPSVTGTVTNGRLGIRYDESDGGVTVTSVLAHGPAAQGTMKLLPGDRIVGVELEPWAAGDTLEQRLAGRVGKETIFDIVRAREGAEPLELRLLLTPTSSGAVSGLRYDEWQRANAALVKEWSRGRVGYIHIRSMNGSSLWEFERDLFAAADGRDGVVLDVRNNGGGYTADLVLASIMVKAHAYTVPRGADPTHRDGYPRDRLYIQRYTQPMNLLCNEKSFSNAEIVSHAFKSLGRGTLVGNQTYGGVISTGRHTLADGTSVRTPFRGWYLMDGTDMENNGAIPDIVVPPDPTAEANGEDAQLRAAVDDLLKRLP